MQQTVNLSGNPFGGSSPPSPTTISEVSASLFLWHEPSKKHFLKILEFFITASNLLYIFALQIIVYMKIFVAKLAFKTTTEDLRALFEQFGTVESCKVIMDHETGRSKCYGFVEMPNDDEAYKAIVETDETVFMGNELQVKKSRPQAAAAPKPEKPVRPKRPHHPYVPKTEELS